MWYIYILDCQRLSSQHLKEISSYHNCKIELRDARPTTNCLTAYLTQYLYGSKHSTRLCISVHSWGVQRKADLLARLRKKMVRLVDYLQDDQNKFRPFQEYNRDIHRKEFGTDLLHFLVAGIFAKWHGRAVGCLSLQW